MLKVAEEVCPDKQQAFTITSQSRNAIAESTSDLAENLNSQPWDKAKSFAAFLVAVDESRDASDVSQLAMPMGGIDENKCSRGSVRIGANERRITAPLQQLGGSSEQSGWGLDKSCEPGLRQGHLNDGQESWSFDKTEGQITNYPA